MEENTHIELEKLRKENDLLRSKFDKDALKEKRKQKNRKKSLAWTWRMFTGKSLFKSFNTWFTEYHTEKKVSPDTSATLLTSLVSRFVRVRMLSVILLLFSLIPSLVSIYILYNQNKLIETQNSLVEASRNSSYAFQLSAVFDKIDRSNGVLSTSLKNRIIGLTQTLKPYKILIEGKLSEESYSPERAQLLLYLINANFNNSSLSDIFDNANFSNCDLRDLNLSGKYLAGINLKRANLENVELNSTNLNNANLNGANLKNIQFSNGTAQNATFINSDLRNAKITRTNLKGVDLSSADKGNANITAKN